MADTPSTPALTSHPVQTVLTMGDDPANPIATINLTTGRVWVRDEVNACTAARLFWQSVRSYALGGVR